MIRNKLVAKILLGVTCLLIIAVLAFSAYSFARYVSQVEGGGNAGVAFVDCKVNVSGSGCSFIDAPFIQQVGQNTQPIRMNSWSESTVSLSNEGKHRLSYRYSFVFYVPQDFALSCMFQLLELKNNSRAPEDDTPSRLTDVERASRIYRLQNPDEDAGVTAEQTSFGIVEATHTARISDSVEPIAITNDYQSVIDANRELKFVDCVAQQSSARESSIKRTYAAYKSYEGNEDVRIYLSPVTFDEAETLAMYKITLNLQTEDLANDEYANADHVLDDGETHNYVLRLVPRKALGNGVAEKDENGKTVEWNASKYFKDDVCLSPNPLSGSESYSYAWLNGTPKLVAYEKSDTDKINPIDVIVGECVGMTVPVRVSAVFIQEQM